MIRVVVGELARLQADAVVRTADADLAPLGETAALLDEAGGARFADQRRTATELEAGAAVVTGGGDLPAPFVLHLVLADERGPGGPDAVRRALVGAWQRAGDWGLARIASPLVGSPYPLTPEEAACLMVETFPRQPPDSPASPAPAELQIVVEAEAQREAVETIVRRSR